MCEHDITDRKVILYNIVPILISILWLERRKIYKIYQKKIKIENALTKMNQQNTNMYSPNDECYLRNVNSASQIR